MKFKKGDLVKIIRGDTYYPDNVTAKIICIRENHYADFEVIEGKREGEVFLGASFERFKLVGEYQTKIED